MIDTTIRTALAPLDIPIKPNGYEGTALEYLSYVYSERGTLYAEGMPQAILYGLDLHWYLPTGKNPGDGKDGIRHALRAAGATWPEIVNASDRDGQHYVFQCQLKGPVPEAPDNG